MKSENKTMIEVYEKIIDSMKISVNNMNWLTKNTNEKIIEAVVNDSVVGRINKKDIINQLLDSERYVDAKRSVYEEVIERCTNEIAILDGTIDLTNGDKDVF